MAKSLASLLSSSMYKDGFFGKKDLNKLLDKGYEKKALKIIASSKTNPVKFGPLALKQLGINTVYGYDPGKFNNAYSYQFMPKGGSYQTVNKMSGWSKHFVDAFTLIGKSKNIPSSKPSSKPTKPAASGADSGSGKDSKGEDVKIDVPNVPDPPNFQFTPGGVSSTVNSQATGFKSKLSSLKIKGLASLGTGIFKSTGQNKFANGLNIGV